MALFKITGTSRQSHFDCLWGKILQCEREDFVALLEGGKVRKTMAVTRSKNAKIL